MTIWSRCLYLSLLIVYCDEYLIYFDKLKRKSLVEKSTPQKYKTQNNVGSASELLSRLASHVVQSWPKKWNTNYYYITTVAVSPFLAMTVLDRSTYNTHKNFLASPAVFNPSNNESRLPCLYNLALKTRLEVELGWLYKFRILSWSKKGFKIGKLRTILFWMEKLSNNIFALEKIYIF